MAWGISMNETPVVSSEYLPRNALDHMSPFFFKSHTHSHTSNHTHAHGYPHLHQQQHQHNRNHTKEDLSPLPLTPPPTSDNQSVSSSCDSDLQTPVPRRSSIHTIDTPSGASYNTPPATPPLTLNENQTPATAAATSGTDATTFPSLAWCTARARIPTPDGSEYFLHIYENSIDKKEHLAFVFGDRIRSQSLDRIQPNETELDRIKRGAYTGRLQPTLDTTNMNTTTVVSTTAATSTTSEVTTVVLDQHQDALMDNSPLVRIHSECFTGEIGHSARCDCGEQLDEAIRLMKAEGSGVVVYLRQEGRGIGLGEKLKAYNLQDLGYDTVMANLLLNHGADERTYEIAQAILHDLGLGQIRLLTNNPDKIEQIEKENHIKVVERVPMMPKSWEAIELGIEAELEVKEGAVENKIVRGKELDRYLKVKVERMRHLIPIPTSL